VQNLKSVQDQLGVYHDLWGFTATLYQVTSKYDGLEPLIESTEQQRHDSFSTLQKNLLVFPVPWLKKLEIMLTILAGKDCKNSNTQRSPSFSPG